MSDNLNVENKANISSQTIINIQSMPGNIVLPENTTTYISTNSMKLFNKAVDISDSISNEYYNIFVIGGETFNKERFNIPISRSVSTYTNEEIIERFGILDSLNIQQLKTLPSLFMDECKYNLGNLLPDQIVYFGYATNVKKLSRDYRISFEIKDSFPVERLLEISRELDIGVDYRGFGEMTHTHWAVKDADLLYELRLAGVINYKNC